MNSITQIHPSIAKLSLWTHDVADLILGRRQPMIPPRHLMYDGPQDPAIFAENGREFFGYYQEICQLQPHEAVVEIGSGMGRKAIPLTSYLNQEGSYLGFEINSAGVEWCQKEITARHPNFRFEHIDVYNGRYNPSGTHYPSDYSFPAADESADFIVLASVFTHMFYADVSRYLSEISRLLNQSTGRCLISYFILNDETKSHIDAGESGLTFSFAQDGCYIERQSQPEDAVAYAEEDLSELYHQHGLKIVEIYRGSWCGRSEFLSYQDLILAEKSR